MKVCGVCFLQGAIHHLATIFKYVLQSIILILLENKIIVGYISLML